MLIIFDIIFIIYACLYVPYLLITRRYYPGFSCRWGKFPASLSQALGQKPTIWVHAVSVGEVSVIDLLIQAINREFPGYEIVATVTTKAGYALAQDRLAGKAIVLPSPLDISWVVKAFIRLIKPVVYVAAETEIWPNLLLALEKQKIPAMIINGRISDTSFPRYKMIKSWLKGPLATIDAVCVQSAVDGDRMIELGVEPHVVHVLGNVKFDDVAQDTILQKALLNVDKEGHVFMAGSTHPGEEEIVLEAYKAIRLVCERSCLVIAPRHVERSDEIVRIVTAQGFNPVRFSSYNKQQLCPGDVVIVDVIGQLRSLYAQADLVFVGKSLMVGGGHNIIEPAMHAKAIVVGPMMQNFRDVLRHFKDAQALIQVDDQQSFIQTCCHLMSHPQQRVELGQRAKAVVIQNQGSIKRFMMQLKVFL